MGDSEAVKVPAFRFKGGRQSARRRRQLVERVDFVDEAGTIFGDTARQPTVIQQSSLRVPRMYRPAAMGRGMGAALQSSDPDEGVAEVDDDVALEKEEMSMTQALEKVHRVYGPDQLFVWLLEITLFVGLLSGVYEVVGMITLNPTGSTPTLPFWAVGSVVSSTVVAIVGMMVASLLRKQLHITDHRFQSVANGVLSNVAAVFVIWTFYGSL
eukprot:279904-Hanusia_phi.AAC.1